MGIDRSQGGLRAFLNSLRSGESFASSGSRLLDIKQNFFDRPAVMSAMSRAERRTMNHAGALTRKIARQSIRKRKKISNPGQPPSSRTGFLRQFIFYHYDWQRGTVIIGPSKLSSNTRSYVVPEVLEFGGRVSRRDYRRAEKVEMRFEARPYMRPALAKVHPRFPGLWKDSLEGLGGR